MAATLALVFRSRLRLLPLALALAAAAMTFGALSLAGGSLTMASIAVLPVLIGLAVDYAIQFQARFDEAYARRHRKQRSAPGRAGCSRQAREAAVAAASGGGPTILTAGVATAVGFIVLLLSPVPMVRGFGALLVLGIALALLCAICAGFAALVASAARGGRPAARPALSHPRLDGAREWLADALLARARRRDHPPAACARDRAGRRRARPRPRHPERGGLGRARARPAEPQALQDVNALQEETGVSGEIDVTVRADDITEPAVIAWMTKFQDGVLRAQATARASAAARRKTPRSCARRCRCRTCSRPPAAPGAGA